MIKISGILITISIVAINAVCMEQEIRIETYQQERDYKAVMSIVRENPEMLMYESAGHRQGTTEKFFVKPEYTTKVLRKGNETVGFINYGAGCSLPDIMLAMLQSFDRESFWDRSGLIHLMGVKHECQGKGYGSLLLEDAISALKDRNVSIIFLGVDVHNQRAKTLYEKSGFRCLVPKYLVPCFTRDKTPLIYEYHVKSRS